MENELKKRLDDMDKELKEIKSMLTRLVNSEAANFEILQHNLGKNIAKMLTKP